MRRKEHIKDYIKAARDRVIPDKYDPKGSWMWDHMFTSHGAPSLDDLDPKRDFRFEAIGGHRDPMTRQVEEAVRIVQARENGSFTNRSDRDLRVKSMNRKDEHFAPRQRFSYNKRNNN